MKRNKVLSLFLSLTLVLGIVIGAMPTVAKADDAVQKFTILHVNDTHGRVSFQDTDRDKELGDAKLKTYFDKVKEENPDTLLLHAGDALHGTTDVNLTKGEAVIDIMNLVGFDALAPGNHDFNYGFEQLVNLKNKAKFPVLAANVEYEKTKELGFEPYEIKELENGLKVGIIGLATPETKYKSHPDNTVGIDFTSPTAAAEKYVKEIRDEVDVVVVLGHLGVEGTIDETSEDVLNKVEGIDLFIDGHSHEDLQEPKIINGAYLVQTGSYLENIGKVDLEVKDGKVSINSKLVPFEELKDTEGNKEIDEYVTKFTEANEALKSEVIGKTEVDLDGKRGNVRTKETNLGNLIADAMRESVGADIAFANGGGIREDIPAGDITVGNVLATLPFTNTVAVIEITGQELIDALENGVSIYPEELGGFPQVSGIKFTFNPEAEAGKRVVSVEVGGKPVDKAATYTIATNDFMAGGGDNYTMFDGKPFVAEEGLLSDVLRKYLEKHEVVNPEIEGRIVRMESKPEEKPEAKPEPKPEAKPEVASKYTVRSGDVLWRIAKKYSKTWEELSKFNGLKNPHLIYPGQTLNIPK